MKSWLAAALDYLPRWIEFQMRQQEQPGCAVAVAYRGRMVLDEAFGAADVERGIRLKPRHRFRVASHSKSFTAAAIMKLRDARRLRLDDAVGRYVKDLHPEVARVSLAQLLSHSAGLVRDGPDSGQFLDERPFLDAGELKRDLRLAPVLRPATRFKYSNHGYALLGLVIEAIAGESAAEWTGREVINAAGLERTLADGPPPKGMPLALGYSAKQPLGRRVAIPGRYSTRAIAPAAGVISTAADLVLFFNQLSPRSRQSILSPASRRLMARPRWPDPHSRFERAYGLGLITGRLRGWDWFGHSGALQGYITRTCVFPTQELAVSVCTNAIDGPAHFWLDGVVGLLRTCQEYGGKKASQWSGRWWTLWGALDLLPMRDRVLAVNPLYFDPVLDANEIRLTGRDRGRIVLAPGYGSHGEGVRLERSRGGKVTAVWIGGTRYRAEAAVRREMAARYDRASAR